MAYAKTSWQFIMKIDALFVLSAGFGRRMGKEGELLPKPLWPLYEKTLLELQFDFYHWIDSEKKIINTHHHGDMIEKFIRSKRRDIDVLHEPELLNVGGAILNLKEKYPKVQSLLISNVDQFSFAEKNLIESELQEIERFDAILFAVPTQRSQGHGKLEISSEGMLLDVNSSPKEESYLTYSGMALINAKAIEEKCTPIGFFQSVAHPKKKKVKVVDIGPSRYFDFGTRERYLREIQKSFESLKKGQSNKLLDFLF